MSILLDALKKSESQRQLGTTPDIYSNAELPSSENATEQQWIPLSMLVLSAVAIAWFGWQQYREPPMSTGSPPPAATAATDAEAGIVREGAGLDSVRTPVESLQSGGKEQPKPQEQSVGDQAVAGEPRKSPNRKQSLSKSVSEYKAPPDKPRSDQAEASSETVVSAVPVKPAPETATQALARVAARKQPSPVEQVTSEPISFWAIPQALRDGMPEIRITVLVYAQMPEDRFVLINGQRLKEKDELASGVVLDEIRRDGAVFKYRKYRFLVKS